MGVNSGPFTASRASWAEKVWPKIVGRFRRAVLAGICPPIVCTWIALTSGDCSLFEWSDSI
jgi:hypothetical protein